MYKLLAIILFTVSSTQGGFVTVWEDNFDGTSLNDNDWEYVTGGNGWGNNELETYTKWPNAWVKDGILNIIAKVENKDGKQFTSTRLNSKKSWTYGRFEIRAKLPKGKGLWPAIWLLGYPENYGAWAACGEIDIMEARGERTNQILGTIHYGGTAPNNIHSGSNEKTFPIDFSADFHEFAVEWNTEKIMWFVDGGLFHTENINRNMWSGRGSNPYNHNGAPFDRNFHFILNLAVGGAFFPESVYGPQVTVDEARKWPKPTMEIDYVRVKQWK